MTRTHRFSSITGPLMSLHWLPVKSRVQFKIGLITYKVYKNKYPAYLENYLQPYGSIYNTRRSEPARHMLSIPHYNYRQHKSFTHLSNSFYYSAPRLWNCETCRCASSLGSFRAHLKTYLWTKSFPPYGSFASINIHWLVPDLFSDNGLYADDYPNDLHASRMRF